MVRSEDTGGIEGPEDLPGKRVATTRASVQIVGPVFQREDYGIVFPANSPLRKQVDSALFALLEGGTYQKLYDKWFIN
jgi:ABC-type amino acid transport substrate-binding protein